MFMRSLRRLVGVAAMAAIVGAPSLSSANAVANQPTTNVGALQSLAAREAAKFNKEKAEAIRLAKLLGLPIRTESVGGHVRELMRFMNGQPIYYETCNLEAAQTVSAPLVWPGGATGLNLTGSGVILGEWDAGWALISHQEITGRAFAMDISSPATHSAHVGGTMIASGVVAAAHGMSFEGILHTYDWNNDSSEMASEAASGLLLSNHSYGSWGPVELYGYYDGGAAYRDQLACDAPYYLICQAAGNSQGANPGKDGYDTLIMPASAKNSLTVGAVNKNPAGYSGPGSVVMSGFSSWGPSDDGRVKPDIVAPGVNLYSCLDSGDTDYGFMSGTSMATPCTTGNLGLLVQYYGQTHNNRAMLSATMKALVIHTADQAGANPGPSYNFGWGQLNTASAALMIKDSLINPDYIQEQTLTQGGTYTYTGNPTGTPIKVTVVWTDPPADGQSSADDRTPRLVNDLDVRVSYNGTTFLPWVLDVENPTAAATTGDNILDNVEQVSCPAGIGPVTITVTNKGATLKPAGVQNFSIIVSGISSSKLTDLSIAPDPVIGGSKTKGTVTISAPAPGSGVWVNLSSDASRKIARVPARALVPGGKTVGTFDITTFGVTTPNTISVTAEYGETSSTTFTVNPIGIQSLVLNPTSVNGGVSVTGTVVIGQAAPAEGAIVRLASNLPKAADVDWQCVIPEGQTTGTFTVRTFAVKKATDVVIRAAYPGPTKYATLRVLPPFALSSFTLNAISVKGGTTVQGTITMNAPAASDTVVSLSSSNTLAATVPATVIVPAGATQVVFNVTTVLVKANKAVTLTATYNGVKALAKLTVKK